MAVPKRKQSKSRKNKRRTHQSVKLAEISFDEQVNEYTRSHYISPSGYCKGRKVL